jgi:hypothetical protein
MNRRGVRTKMRERGHPVRRVSLILAALVVIGIVVAIAVNALSPPSPATGTLTGTLQALGGPGGAGPRPLSGTITAKTSGKGILTSPVGADGRFTVHPVVGTYTVSGSSPQFEDGKAECHASEPVTVTKDVTSRVTVDCQEQ